MQPVTVQQSQHSLVAWRCWKCGRILAKLSLVAGCTVEIKCKCNAMNVAAVDKRTSED